MIISQNATATTDRKIYIYIYRERERARQKEKKKELHPPTRFKETHSAHQEADPLVQ